MSPRYQSKLLSTALFILTVAGNLCIVTTSAHSPDAEPTNQITSIKNGNWSDPSTWDLGRVPAAKDKVLVHSKHRVLYDVCSDEIIRSVHVSGCLQFATDRNTKLEVGLLRIESGDDFAESGFDCNMHMGMDLNMADRTAAALLIGTPDNPVDSDKSCLIRLHYIEGTDAKTWPAIVCCGGRMEIHGAPLSKTWVKLTRTADAGATRLFLTEPVEGWNAGDKLVVTGTSRQEPSAGVQTEHVTDQPSSEVRQLVDAQTSTQQSSMTGGAKSILSIDKPLARTHLGGEYSAEVANLSRNVVIESADLDKPRGHTMYHHGSTGSISYAEFRHLGKEGVLGKYPIHFHLVGATMRGSSVIGASVWDSHNRWITVHGAQYLVLRDNVGFQSKGHGFFLEDGTENCNVLDRNLAIQALVAKPLPDQVLPFDRNDGAGFWWANNYNVFTRNVAVECDQHGFRFEAEKTANFDPELVMPLPGQPRDSVVDIRTLPFIRFEDNEAHCQRRFGLNLGGIRGLTYGQFGDIRNDYDLVDSVAGTTGGVGPLPTQPLTIRNFRVWDTHWAFHTFCPAVQIDGLDVFECNYGIWRSVIDEHQYDNISFRKIHAHTVFFPMGGYRAGIEVKNNRPNYPNYREKDDTPPITIIVSATKLDDDTWRVTGVSSDNAKVASVYVNDKKAVSTRNDFAEWTIELPASSVEKPFSAYAIDAAGNQEQSTHTFESTTMAKQ